MGPSRASARNDGSRCLHGCAAASAASGVNERAAVWSNTAHAPAHFTPALIDRCPFGLSLSLLLHPFFSSLFLPIPRHSSFLSPLRVRVLARAHTRHRPSTSWKTSAGRHEQPRTTSVRKRDGDWRSAGFCVPQINGLGLGEVVKIPV